MPNSSTIDNALYSLYESIFHSLQQAENIKPMVVPARFASMAGCLRDTAVKMKVNRYLSINFESIILARLYDDQHRTKTVTLIGLPQQGSALPIVGLDAVAIGKRWGLLALDLAMTDESFWEENCKLPLKELQQGLVRDLQQRKVPQFTENTFSPLAVIAAVNPGAELDVASHVSEFIQRTVLPLLNSRDPMKSQNAQAAIRNRNWRVAERDNRKEQKALTEIFGDQLAREFIEHYLFPKHPLP